MAAAICEQREMFLTNHALVLASLAGDPGLRVRDIAARVGVTERAVESIVRDLTTAGYLTKVRNGRRNRYRLHLDRPFQHPLVSHRSLSRLVHALVPDWETDAAAADDGPPAIPETSISCVGADSTLILHQTGQSGAEGGSVKRVLVYIAVGSLMVLATAAAAAAIGRRADPQPGPRHHPTRQAQGQPAASRQAASPAPVYAAAGLRPDLRVAHATAHRLRNEHDGPTLRPPRGRAPAGGPPVPAPPPPTVSTVTLGIAGAGTTVSAGADGVKVTVRTPAGGAGVTVAPPATAPPPVLGITLGP
jgi:hypothetical protein